METMKTPDLPPVNQRQIGYEYPLVYTIQVIGHVEKSWSNRLSGLHVQTANAGLTNEMEITILTGELLDQAALMGVLNALYNLRLTIWSVECLGTPADSLL
jgi:hypothetical protein